MSDPVPHPQEPSRPEAAPPPRECELPHSVCVRCGTEMDLIKTKWVCPKCKWIIGCCD